MDRQQATAWCGDRRFAIAPGQFPPTVSEPGCWECDVGGGSWVAYEWPNSSILEQAFCCRHTCVDLSMRSIQYRVQFNEDRPDGCLHEAVQVNVQTCMRRQVRRWPSKWHKSQHAVRLQEQAQAAWGAWLQADWAWVLLEADDVAPTEGQPKVPKGVAPARVPYSLGASSGALQGAFWPALLRSWPVQELVGAAHPLGRRCNFALRRLTALEANVEMPLPSQMEWAALSQLWNNGGLAAKCPLKGAYRIQNRGLIRSFAATQQAMVAGLGGDEFSDGAGRESQLSVRLLWHGTRNVSGLMDICSDGFDRAFATTCIYGKGCYFSASTAYSEKYACSVKVPGEPARNFRAMLLAAVLVGELVQGTKDMYPPPVKPHSRTGERFENACDKVSAPSIFVTFKDYQALPAYVVIYEQLP